MAAPEENKKGSHVCRHARHFADADGSSLTVASMIEGHRRYGVSE